MESLQQFTHTLNVFVRFFESVNCLFWQLGWLRQNIQQSSLDLLLTVAAIASVALLFTLPAETLNSLGAQLDAHFGLPASTSIHILRLLPLLLVAAVIFMYLRGRWQQKREVAQAYAVVEAEEGNNDVENNQLPPLPSSPAHLYPTAPSTYFSRSPKF